MDPTGPSAPAAARGDTVTLGTAGVGRSLKGTATKIKLISANAQISPPGQRDILGAPSYNCSAVIYTATWIS